MCFLHCQIEVNIVVETTTNLSNTINQLYNMARPINCINKKQHLKGDMSDLLISYLSVANCIKLR